LSKTNLDLVQQRTVDANYWSPTDDAAIYASVGEVSVFGDDVWDLCALRGRTTPWTKKIEFHKLGQLGIAESAVLQMKTLVYLFLQEHGPELPSASTFCAKYYALRQFAVRCSKLNLELYVGLQQQEQCVEFINEHPAAGVELFSMLLKLRRYSKHFDLEVPFQVIHPLIVDVQKQMRRDERQTPPLPSRIYSHVLSQLENELRVLERVLPDLLQFLHSAQGSTAGDYPLIGLAIEDYRAHLSQGHEAPRRSDIAGWISNAYAVCRAVIAANTGMRRAEAEGLPFRALERFERGGSSHNCVRGYTSKLHKGLHKETVWITNRLGERAVQVAQAIAKTLYELDGVTEPAVAYPELLLFPRHGWGVHGRLDGHKPQQADIAREKLFARISPAIEVADLDELAQIDGDRSWDDDEDFRVGARWALSMHQFRRSLALYAHRSGLVTLPSLKTQLQHLTKEMAEYYARGSEFATSLQFDKEHFATDWNASRALSEYLGYAMHVLLSDEKLFGGAASWAKSPAVVASPVSVYSREHAIQLFERGELAYKETILGGCTSTTQCSAAPLAVVPYHCVESNCKNLVVRQSKLEKVIETQELVVQRIGEHAPNSVEHRLELHGLEVLKATFNKMKFEEPA
jgi:hypothetical protein